MTSMRAVGYSLHTAIADIVDNAITADASTVNVLFNGSTDDPYVAVLDNGIGMDATGSREAMRLAGSPATGARHEHDLGRFGLGLKTASLSQCRRLTVATLCNGELTALSWDLDIIEETGAWQLVVHNSSEIDEIPHIADLRLQDSGTLVVWRTLDRLIGGAVDVSRHLDSLMADAREHLAVVFHRFIAGDETTKLTVAVNHVPIEKTDPFLSTSRGTQVAPLEVLHIDGASVTVQAYTLPFVNKMSHSERATAISAGSLRDTQGFYIYRAKRLIVWGTWFRLAPKNEMGRLTRVRVDIPNSLDHLWSLDIKKSSAVPPAAVRERLRELATRFVEPSERVHRFRGRRMSGDDPIVRMWNVIEDRGSARYEINRSHPSIEQLGSDLSPEQLVALGAAFDIIETAFPAHDLFNRMSGAAPIALGRGADETLADTLIELYGVAGAPSAESFIDTMMRAEPFDKIVGMKPELIARLRREPSENNGH